LPAIAELEDGHFIVIARVDEERVLIQDPREGRPTMMARKAFEKEWSGHLILFTKRANFAPGRSQVRFHLVHPRHCEVPQVTRRGLNCFFLYSTVCPLNTTVLPGGDR
jgi:ABC-type bacteriocin/lantibiotic exporter with double-glycine peptidase domain